MRMSDGNTARRVREEALVGGAVFLPLIFWYDLSQPANIASAVLYVLPVVLALLARSLAAIVAYSLAASILIVLGYTLSASARGSDFVLVNNLLSLVAVWSTALVSMLYVITSDAYEKRLEERAVIDPLTEIYNRRHLTMQLDLRIREAIRYGAPLTVLLVDLDGFKEANDRHGHLAGDRILRQAANIIAQTIRGVDLVGRYGGDEFLVIMPRTPIDDATRVAERIRVAVREASAGEGSASLESGLSVSIGVASLDRTAPTVEALVDSADRALYQAKRAGRNRVVHFGDLKIHTAPPAPRRIG